MTMAQPLGETRPLNGEPRAAYATVYPTGLKPTRCDDIITSAQAHGLQSRAAARCDQLHLTSRRHAEDLLGLAAVDELVELMDTANERWWRLDIDSYQLKILRYQAGHHAPSHVDMFPGSMRRKLTMVVQLSWAASYKGGDLEVQQLGDPWIVVPRGRGVAAVFPAWTRHRVTPIETGERWTIAAWGYGPPVR